MTIETILPTPDIFSAKRIFCVQPHYDDDDIGAGETKLSVVRCYQAQFNPQGMDELVTSLEFKSCQVSAGKDFEHGEPLKILHPSGLHGGI